MTVIISSTSLHPLSHKRASFNSMMHQAINVPLTLRNKNYNNEINIIKALNNGYKHELINQLVNKRQAKIFTKKNIYCGNNNSEPTNNKIYIKKNILYR